MVVGSMLTACTELATDKDELVVEGWICQDSHPVVLIHQSYAINNPEHAGNEGLSFEEIMQQQLIVWGRVVIDDGDEQIVLTGRLDTLYTPPFVYTTAHMKGEVGKTYRITVDYEDYHGTAYSTIQPPISVDSISIKLEPNTQTSHITAYLSHLPPDSYYLVEYRTQQEHQFTICPLGTASTEQVKDGILSINILSQNSEQNAMSSAAHHFETDNKTYIIRLIHINHEQYTYFSALVNQLASQGMYFMSAYRNLPTNIDGGIGYWAGFGKEDYAIKINRDTTYIY